MPWVIELLALPVIRRWPARKLHPLLVLPVLQNHLMAESMLVVAQPLGSHWLPLPNKQSAALRTAARHSMPWLVELQTLPAKQRQSARKLHPLLALPALLR